MLSNNKNDVEPRKHGDRGLDSFSAIELANMDLSEPDWLIDNLLPQGLAMICADPKVGKSWMALQMCLAIAQGEPFLDHQTNQAGTFYLALEDTRARLKKRQEKQLNGNPIPQAFHYSDKLVTLNEGLLDCLDSELEKYPDIRLVVIDTFQMIRGRSSNSELAYATDTRELSKLKSFADEHNICILLIHHRRKMKDDTNIFNTMLGSTGILGKLDVAIVLDKRRPQDTSAKMAVSGRDVEQFELDIKFNTDNCNWTLNSSAAEERQQQLQEKYNNDPIVRILRQLLTSESTSLWQGTATELRDIVFAETQQFYTAASLGKQITMLEEKLKLEGIYHSTTRTGEQKTHTFEKYQHKQLTIDSLDDEQQ